MSGKRVIEKLKIFIKGQFQGKGNVGYWYMQNTWNFKSFFCKMSKYTKGKQWKVNKHTCLFREINFMIPAALQLSEVKNFIKGLGKSGENKTTCLL